jgi:hypothetical protein
MSDQIADNTPEIVLDTNGIVLGPVFGNVQLTVPHNITLHGANQTSTTPAVTLSTSSNIFAKPIVIDPLPILSEEDPAT